MILPLYLDHYVSKIIIFSILWLIITKPILAEQNLPDFGDSSQNLVSAEYDRRLGQLFLREVRQSKDVVDDPEIVHYIQSIGQRLVSHSDTKEDQPFHFLMLQENNINAFAGPGGVIGINSGIMLQAQNESEFAAVLAHEIAHVTQRHLARAFENSKKLSLPVAAAALGALILSTQNPQAGSAALTTLFGLSTQNKINFTRKNEQEADRIGIQFLAKSGFDPNGMPNFFKKLQRSEYRAIPEFLRTHPISTNRMADSTSRAKNYPQPATIKSSRSYQYIRYKLIAYHYSAQYAITLLSDYLKDRADKDAIRYGLAHALIRDNQFEQAQKQAQYLLKKQPNDLAHLLLLGKIKAEQLKFDSALSIYQKAYNLQRDYRPAVIAYTRSLLDNNKPKEARMVLRRYVIDRGHDLLSYSLLGQAEGTLGNQVEVGLLQAGYYHLAGYTELAIEKLLFMQQHFKMNYYQSERLSALLQNLQHDMSLQKDMGLS